MVTKNSSMYVSHSKRMRLKFRMQRNECDLHNLGGLQTRWLAGPPGEQHPLLQSGGHQGGGEHGQVDRAHQSDLCGVIYQPAASSSNYNPQAATNPTSATRRLWWVARCRAYRSHANECITRVEHVELRRSAAVAAREQTRLPC